MTFENQLIRSVTKQTVTGVSNLLRQLQHIDAVGREEAGTVVIYFNSPEAELRFTSALMSMRWPR